MIIRGVLPVVAAATLWGCLGPFSKLAFSQGMDPLEVAFWRAGFGWIFFLAQAVWTRGYKIAPKDLPAITGFGFLGVTVFFGSYQIAVQNSGAALAAVLLYTAPAWVAILARLILGETLTSMKLVCVGLTIAGVAGVALGSSATQAIRVTPLGIAAGLVAGLSYALYYIFGKHYLNIYPTHTIFAYTLPVGLLGLLPWIHFHPMTPIGLAAVFFLGLATTFGAYTFYCIGLKHLDASKAAIVATLEPVVAGVMAYFWWGERFTLTGYLGISTILGAVLLLVYTDTKAA
ncbi:DMT family transporter [Desulfoplanes formicivorans]|uniref:Membrane protein n=1 Tax=Desulfoplanes formicivorans TaxID=1592317 RepID=A0A194AL47_9BACT|nr:EamA family transporter [Desulfoplanes formicivorans]GAU09766.1 membrane protein [Desulfoplanes formicivorans]